MRITGFGIRVNDVDKLNDVFTKRCIRKAKINVKEGDPVFSGYAFSKDQKKVGKVINTEYIEDEGIRINAEITDKEIKEKLKENLKFVFRFVGDVVGSDTINKVRVVKEIELKKVAIIQDSLNEEERDHTEPIGYE